MRPSSGVVQGRLVRAGISAVSAVAVVMAVGGFMAPAGADPTVPAVDVAAAGAPVTPQPATATNVTVQCPGGESLIDGGMWADNADPADPTPPANGLRAKSSFPSDDTGAMVAAGAVNPTVWSATANFGGEAELGDQMTSFALCTNAPLADRVIATASINGPTASATQARITVACPPGTTVLGGGGVATPPGSPSFKVIGMYPSDADGNMLPDGEANPTFWTAVGSAGGSASADQTTFAYAVCAAPVGFTTRVARVDAPGPQVGSTHTTTTATCGPDALIGGGENVDNSVGVVHQGVHLRGSYPSDAAGVPAAGGSTAPAGWTVIVNAGGQDSPNTEAHAFAICAVPAPTCPAPTPAPTAPQQEGLLVAGAIGATYLFTSRKRAPLGSLSEHQPEEGQ